MFILCAQFDRMMIMTIVNSSHIVFRMRAIAFPFFAVIVALILTTYAGSTYSFPDSYSGEIHTLEIPDIAYDIDDANNNNTIRSVDLFIHSKYSTRKKWPLVVLLHGLGQTGEGTSTWMRMNATSEELGFLFVARCFALCAWISACADHVRPPRELPREASFFQKE